MATTKIYSCRIILRLAEARAGQGKECQVRLGSLGQVGFVRLGKARLGEARAGQGKEC